MKQTKDKIFIDTNVLIYSYSSDELAKRSIAQELVSEKAIISTQVINEFINVMHKKRAVPFAVLVAVIRELAQKCVVNAIGIETINYALMLGEKFRYSYFDSLIIASALLDNCCLLYSEDMHHRQVIEGRLTIINPFKDAGL